MRQILPHYPPSITLRDGLRETFAAAESFYRRD
jgi:hypothetical protein